MQNMRTRFQYAEYALPTLLMLDAGRYIMIIKRLDMSDRSRPPPRGRGCAGRAG